MNLILVIFLIAAEPSFYGAAAEPSFYGADVCNDDLSITSLDSLTASSEYDVNDKTTNHGPDRAHLNTTEVKDAAGVMQMGSWVAEKNNFNQWIQIKLKDVSLIRGLTTQGRNGCCKQWVTKYRVLYSEDCKTWHTVGGFNVTDAFFNANSDQDTPETNMFHCPVLAKCIRINPLGWSDKIAMRLAINGCSITNGASTSPSPTVAVTTSSPAMTTTQQPVTTTQQPAATTQQPATTTQQQITTTQLPAITTAALKPTPKLGSNSGKPAGKPTGCIKSCKGRANGDYQSCSGCGMYTTCNWSITYDKRPCPPKLVWDDKKKRCVGRSTTCF